MLNELYQASVAMRKRNISLTEPHPAVEPMGQNKKLLLVQLDAKAKTKGLKVLSEQEAGRLIRISHGSKGSSFPGFNLPSPFDLKFTASQETQFKRSVQELVGWLKEDFKDSASGLKNVVQLLETVSKARLELGGFSQDLAEYIGDNQGKFSKDEEKLFLELISCDLKEKKEDTAKGVMPIFLDLIDGDPRAFPVADSRTARLINDHLLRITPLPYDSSSRLATSQQKKEGLSEPVRSKDAYTGATCAIPDKYPEPKLESLGATKLFSNNSNEAECFFRYGLGDMETFVVSEENIKKITAAAFTLAGNDLALRTLGGVSSSGKTCRAIPSGRKGKQDLLIAYLEDEPNAPDPYVELFGHEAAAFDVPDFAAATSRVLEALDGKVKANPNQRIRLFAIASLDKANKQISLNRSFTVREVVDAAKSWQSGAANCPPVTLPFDKNAEKPLQKGRTVPSPLDTASVLNKVWAADNKGGMQSSFQRVISASDAYDLFLNSQPAIREGKTRLALRILVDRMSGVFAAAGALKAASDYKTLNEPARWQVLKAISLIGIFLSQLGKEHKTIMKEPTYQLGRLLAHADSLHQQYCKHVRDGKMPAQLIGNALFATALEQPVFALARLAERLVPYQAWAKTFGNTNSDGKSGDEKMLLKLIADCAAHFVEEHDGKFVIRVDELPTRMSDTDKAKLILGYLADN